MPGGLGYWLDGLTLVTVGDTGTQGAALAYWGDALPVVVLGGIGGGSTSTSTGGAGGDIPTVPRRWQAMHLLRR